ncbi:ethanolamine transporter [Bacillus sp. TS-2]|nr:ethanolamine transporter [Bacillus sp. TS-2]
MNMNQIILAILSLFIIIGAIDYLLGNKFGFGERFKEGMMAMGPLGLVIIGIVSLAPVIANLLIPIVTPVYQMIGADPATFANTILALDMGGFALAEQMALSEEAALFAWVLLGTMLGPTISFTIPVALGLVKRENHPFLAKGIMIGLSTIPLGCLVGGLIAGFSLDLLLKNLLIPSLLSLFIVIGLLFFMNGLMKIFQLIGKFVSLIAIVGLVAISVETLTGLVIIPGLAPITDGIQIVGMIAIVLMGAFPLVTFMTKVLNRPLSRVGESIGLDSNSTAGIIASLAHIIPMFSLLNDMNERGKIVNIAFAVSGAFVLGGHLGFVAGVNQEMVTAMVIGKLTGGASAVLLALTLTRDKTKRNAWKS